ncbi:low molecular weight phosphotyrosine protein phosphatase [Mariprofundus ferrooxydans]|nr:low molecular weight phosphotyrosine protein phosphatase [Mariprofundus ferrooxydans]
MPVPEHKKIRVLFVCLGNICRSPLAEVVVQSLADRRGVSHHYHFESAGTGDWHVGGSADRRSADKAIEHGLDLTAHRAQQITAFEINRWDYFVAMDEANYQALVSMGADASRLFMMRQFESQGGEIAADVPDPYYGGNDGFETVYQMLIANAAALLDHLESGALAAP